MRSFNSEKTFEPHSTRHPPGGTIRPRLQSGGGPFSRLVRVANIAGIWNLHRVCIARRDEVEGMAANVLIRDRLRDLRHVTSNAFAARTSGFMMGMLLDGCCMRPGLAVRAMAIEAQGIAGLA